MRAHKISAKVPALVLTAVAAVVSLTACDPGTGVSVSASTNSVDSSSSASGSATPTTGGSGGSGAGSSTGSGTSGSGTSGQAGAANTVCRTKDLVVSASGGMAEGEILFNFKNTGGAACTMHGFPGVDLGGDDGIGVSAARSTSVAAPDVTLAPGEETRAALHYKESDSGDTFTRVTITPPNETQSRVLDLGDLAVTVPDSGNTAPPVTVDPVGSGK
ncbi:DUF4232 domain-containing protein [Streptomyces sp. NPDC008150]|uniref:DUF4232 domain-containing protein n=1 Tax=Streptomyces sp. NPDC008150 TaxID=3364816 RepID=UPI0036F17F45